MNKMITQDDRDILQSIGKKYLFDIAIKST